LMTEPLLVKVTYKNFCHLGVSFGSIFRVFLFFSSCLSGKVTFPL